MKFSLNLLRVVGMGAIITSKVYDTLNDYKQIHYDNYYAPGLEDEMDKKFPKNIMSNSMLAKHATTGLAQIIALNVATNIGIDLIETIGEL